MSKTKKTQVIATVSDICTQEISRSAKGRSDSRSNISNSEIMENPSVENEMILENENTTLENQKEENEKENTLRSLTIENYKHNICVSPEIMKLEIALATAKMNCLISGLHAAVKSFYADNINDEEIEVLWKNAKEISGKFQYDFVSSISEGYELRNGEEKLTCGNKLRFKVSNPATKPVEIVARFNAFMEYARLANLPCFKPFKAIEDRAKATENVNKVVASALESLSVEEIQKILAAKLGL